MIEKVEKFLKEIFPMCKTFQIEQVGEVFKCKYTAHVSDIYGEPIIRSSTINVGIVDGFFKIVE